MNYHPPQPPPPGIQVQQDKAEQRGESEKRELFLTNVTGDVFLQETMLLGMVGAPG